MSVNLVKHTGGCHCGKVRFEVLAKPELRAYDCKWVVEHSVFLTFVEINIQLRSALNSTSNSQFLKGFCLKSSIPFPFFQQLFYLCQKGNEAFPGSKGKFQASTGTKQIGIFPTNPRSAFFRKPSPVNLGHESLKNIYFCLFLELSTILLCQLNTH